MPKYFKLNDHYNSGFVDPILVYRTDDERIKILVYYRAISHQNGKFDFERNTKFDVSYYELPIGIKKRVCKIISISENEHSFFYCW